ncbi:hypothetical protein [Streptomyces millisiae]|uniref:Transposase n=1 Tax=Streptomyces millisiae TaxID=3075542 RepID=A0ABU2LMG6_9ACTN|nr:hypothetical protein [Streptomyces sp. DSM 44918]MDT0318758.1 hypothetical protein [Streptomyces sp. DSM 44918]
MAHPNLDDVLDELYGLAPEDFTVRRDAAAASARRAGDRELARRVKALRRPTLAAWASNLLVRAHADEKERFLALGEALRRAQEQLDADRLRELLAQRHALVAALAEQAADAAAEAGHRLGEAARRDVEGTLLAALADPEAARAWSAGHLTHPLHAPADLPTITSEGATTTRRRRKPDQAARRAAEREAERTAAREAEREARARRAAREAAEKRLAEARRHVDELSTALDRAREDLRQAEREAEAAAREG